MAADGRIVVADADAFGGRGGVIRVDPKTRRQSKVASDGMFVNPFDVPSRPRAGSSSSIPMPQAPGA